jgi:hypothetical protein
MTTRAARPLRLVLALASSSGIVSCALFGANLPPGNAGGAFLDEPSGLPSLSANMHLRRDALDDAARVNVEGHFELLKDLTRSSAALREQMARAERQLEQSYRKDRRVSVQDRELLLEGAHWFIELDLLLYNLWSTYRAYLPYGSEPDPYAPYRGASLLSRQVRIKGGFVALAAEVVRMDNAQVVLDLLDGQWAMSQFLNRGDETRGIEAESFDRIVGAFRDPDRRALLKTQLNLVLQERNQIEAMARDDAQVAFLLALIDESRVAQQLLEESSVGRQLRFAGAVLARSGVAMLTPFLNLYIAALLPDDTTKRVGLRRLAPVPGLAEALLDELRPLDVLLLRDAARSPTALGFTHAVIFLGEYGWLKESSLTEHLAFTVNKAQLRRGRTFLDVSQRGAELVDLDEVLEAQDVVVLRYPMEERAREASLRRGFDALTSRRFLTPPQLSQPEHAAALLGFLLADTAFGAAAGEAPRQPSLHRLTRRALERSEVELILATLDGQMLSADRRREALRVILERQGPIDDVLLGPMEGR